MNEIRKLMETLDRIDEDTSREKTGVLWDASTNILTFNAGGAEITIDYDAKEVSINHGHGENMWFRLGEWQDFVDGITGQGLREDEDDIRYDPQPGDDAPLEKPGFNKDGYRTVLERLPITGIEGNIFKVTAVDYDASVPSNMAEVDGVMIGWYEHERDENVYIHIRDLEKILNTVKSKL